MENLKYFFVVFLGLEVLGFPGDKDKKYDLYNSKYLLYHEDLANYLPGTYYVIDPKNLKYFKINDKHEFIEDKHYQPKFITNEAITISEIVVSETNGKFSIKKK